MSQGTYWPKQQIGVLVSVIVAHGLLLLLLVAGLSLENNPLLKRQPPVQLPVPLPIAMVEIIETPGATGNPTANVSQHDRPTPSLDTMAKPDNVAKSVTRPIIKPQFSAANKTLEQAPKPQNTQSVSNFVDSKTAISANERKSGDGNASGSLSVSPSGHGAGTDAGKALHNGASNGQDNSAGAQSVGSAGKNSAPRFGAAYFNNPAPDYPPIARRNGEQGKVLLRVLVTRDGLAKQVNLYASSGSASLDKAALTAVKKWRFVPARQGDEAVDAWVQVPILFKLDP